ncbi:hypothetical protein [Pelagicoccus mobilis]|uniref:Uncharacterized protein n=1 Tax=Pelagicoccus mobilis TaxID=415221 RepID=A0A934RZS3_9BACT|nr:hypothetical protein [Pelagicoccus mobilis]MBK1880645.1 hypothetical protein [Pelagicoccus mobilis]
MKRHLKIQFTDGNVMQFEFSPSIEEHRMGSYLDQMMSLSNLIIEAEGRVMLFPTQNIKFIEVYPAPQKLGTNIIRAAKIVD